MSEKKGGQVVGTLKSIEHIKLIAFKNTVERRLQLEVKLRPGHFASV